MTLHLVLQHGDQSVILSQLSLYSKTQALCHLVTKLRIDVACNEVIHSLVQPSQFTHLSDDFLRGVTDDHIGSQDEGVLQDTERNVLPINALEHIQQISTQGLLSHICGISGIAQLSQIVQLLLFGRRLLIDIHPVVPLASVRSIVDVLFDIPRKDGLELRLPCCS